MNGIELVKTRVNDNNEVIVSARELYEFLEVSSKYNDWFNRMKDFGFEENIDYVTVTQKKVTAQGNEVSYNDHALKIDMAKEIAMLQRSEKGKQARQYFIAVEKAWNSPEKIMERALQFAKQRAEEAERIIMEQRPKVLFAECVEDSDSTILIGDFSKILNQNGVDIGQNRLFKYLRENGYLIKRGDYHYPTQKSMNLKVFRLTERTINTPKGAKITPTVKVTGKGQVYFTNKFLKEIK